MQRIDDFIASAGIDKNVEGWRTRLPKPTPLEFAPNQKWSARMRTNGSSAYSFANTSRSSSVVRVRVSGTNAVVKMPRANGPDCGTMRHGVPAGIPSDSRQRRISGTC